MWERVTILIVFIYIAPYSLYILRGLHILELIYSWDYHFHGVLILSSSTSNHFFKKPSTTESNKSVV